MNFTLRKSAVSGLQAKSRPQARVNQSMPISYFKDGPKSFEAIKERLLEKAASRIDTRSITTCIPCKGSGETVCPVCHGAGVASSTVNRAKANFGAVMGQIGTKLGSKNAKMSGSRDLLATNRCQCCRGTGACMCDECQGKGVRGPPQLVANLPLRSRSPVARF